MEAVKADQRLTGPLRRKVRTKGYISRIGTCTSRTVRLQRKLFGVCKVCTHQSAVLFMRCCTVRHVNNLFSQSRINVTVEPHVTRNPETTNLLPALTASTATHMRHECVRCRTLFETSSFPSVTSFHAVQVDDMKQGTCR